MIKKCTQCYAIFVLFKWMIRMYFFHIPTKRSILKERGDGFMAFQRGPKEPVQEVETNIWSCTNESCQGWMRESFTFEKEPACPLCESEMALEVKVLPELK